MTISPLRGNRIAVIGLVAALLAIATATLAPQDSPRPDVSFLCVRCGDVGGPDLILNVLLFLPLGFALAHLGWPAQRALVFSFALSLGIELAQFLIPGRASTLRDVLCNAAGGWLGALLAMHFAGLLRASTATRWRLAAAIALAVGTAWLTGFLLVISPGEPPYFGHWAPDQEHLEHWTGRVTRAELDGIPIPDWQLDDPERVRREISDGFRLVVEATGGARPDDQSGIVTISDGRMNEVLLVGPEGTTLVVRVARIAQHVRFASTRARFPELMLGSEDGVPFTLTVEVTQERVCAAVNARSQCVERPGAGSLWILLRGDQSYPAAARILLNALSLAALLFPVGLLLPAVRPSTGIGLAVITTAGTVFAARFAGLAWPVPAEWSGLVGGLVAGLLVNRLVTRTAPPTAGPSLSH